MVRLAVVLGVLAFAAPAVAEDSVVIGHGISNAFLSDSLCTEHSLCMDANYVWVLDADRTVAGPSVSGRVRAIASQHTDATGAFVQSVELFVLRPIKDSPLRKSSGAEYYLVSLSPRYSEVRYCLSVKPSDVGLKLSASDVVVDAGRGGFCFPAAALVSGNHSIAAEPPGLRDAIAKHEELGAERSRRLYGAHIPPVDPAAYEFDFALVDLNGDGIPDAVVLFKGPENCGSEGCNLEIFRGTKQGFEFISGSTISREPIQILAERRFGWRSFTVSVSGGGVKPCNALMRFNGQKYPLNPSMAPCATPAQVQSALPVTMIQ